MSHVIARSDSDQAFCHARLQRDRAAPSATFSRSSSKTPTPWPQNARRQKRLRPRSPPAARCSKYLGKNTYANVLGTTETYADANNYNVSDGRFIKREDINGENSVIVLGSKVKEELFAGRRRWDEYIKVHGPARLACLPRSWASWKKKATSGSLTLIARPSFPSPLRMKKLYGLDAVGGHPVRRHHPESEGHRRSQIPDQEDHAAAPPHPPRPEDDFEVQAQGEFLKQFNQFQNIFAVVLYFDRRHLARGRRHRHHEYHVSVAVT